MESPVAVGNKIIYAEVVGGNLSRTRKHSSFCQEKRALIDRLLLEKIPLAGIVRVVEVSESWLQRYVNEKYENVSRQVEMKSKQKACLTIECDEMWSFVGK